MSKDTRKPKLNGVDKMLKKVAAPAKESEFAQSNRANNLLRERQKLRKAPEDPEDYTVNVPISIGTQDDKVIMLFPEPAEFIGFAPESAVRTAQALIRNARSLGYTGSIEESTEEDTENGEG